MSSQVLIGDALATLKTLSGQSAQTCITSPPYFNHRDYGVPGQLGLEQTPEQFVRKIVDVFREVRRVLKDNGTLWLNLGDSYDNRKSLLGIPWRVAFALQADGWLLRQDIIWNKPNPMPESVRDRCTKAHEYVFLLAKQPKYYFDAGAIKEPRVQAESARGFRGGSYVNGETDNSTLGKRKTVGNTRVEASADPLFPYGKRNKHSVWTVTPAPFKSAHFATFPPALIEPMVLAGSKPGDTVLDPFCGAGTTGLVASQHGRNFVGIELNADYAAMSEVRIARAVPALPGTMGPRKSVAGMRSPMCTNHLQLTFAAFEKSLQ